MNFGEYYKDLLEYHDKCPRDMIRDWRDSEIRVIKKAIENAVNSAGFIGTTMEGFEGKTNQTRGNGLCKVKSGNSHMAASQSSSLSHMR